MQLCQSLRFGGGSDGLRPRESGIHKLATDGVVPQHAVVVLQMDFCLWSVHVRKCALHFFHPRPQPSGSACRIVVRPIVPLRKRKVPIHECVVFLWRSFWLKNHKVVAHATHPSIEGSRKTGFYLSSNRPPSGKNELGQNPT